MINEAERTAEAQRLYIARLSFDRQRWLQNGDVVSPYQRSSWRKLLASLVDDFDKIN